MRREIQSHQIIVHENVRGTTTPLHQSYTTTRSLGNQTSIGQKFQSRLVEATFLEIFDESGPPGESKRFHLMHVCMLNYNRCELQ